MVGRVGVVLGLITPRESGFCAERGQVDWSRGDLRRRSKAGPDNGCRITPL